MSHSGSNSANLVNGWTVSARSPSVEHLQATLTANGDPAQAGNTRVDLALDIDFTNADPVVIRFDGANATNQIYAFLDLQIANNTGNDWQAFNISAVDQASTPDPGDYNAAHPFFSHFHDVAEDSFTTFSTREAWNTVLGTQEPNNAGNAWEFSGGTYASGSAVPLSFQNFRTHQYNQSGGTGGTFYVILTPNQAHVDYSGYRILEDTQNLDFLEGDFGGATPRKDMLFGYQGDDLIEGGELADLLYGAAGEDRLLGGKGSDTLRGGMNDDLLNGGEGVDHMAGGRGDDVYVVTTGDTVLETAGAEFGEDTVRSATSYTLKLNVENLRLTGNGTIQGFGNSAANEITGTSGNNLIAGKGGNDLLKGLGGKDAFLFDTAPGPGNVDHIASFVAIDDTIRLESAIYKKIGLGVLAPTKFKDLTTGPADAGDRILYNSDSGALFYDRDGSGAAGRVLFAVIDNDPVLKASDFVIV